MNPATINFVAGFFAYFSFIEFVSQAMFRLFFSFIFLFCVFTVAVSAQIPAGVEDSINHYLNEIAGKNGDEQTKADASLRSLLKRTLLKPEAFSHPFGSVKQMSTLTSPDLKFRIFNWNIPLEDGLNRYSCILVTYDAKKKMSKVYELIQNLEPYSDQSLLTEKNWPGALYYDIIPVLSKGQHYYVLLGWDGNTNLSNKKVAEVLHFQSGKPKFGLPVFLKDKKSAKRLTFEYKEDAIFSIKYSTELKALVFENLGPLHPSLEGQFSQYVPLGNSDGYFLEKGKWHFKADVDYKRGKDEKDKPWNDPGKPDMNRSRNTTNPLIEK